MRCEPSASHSWRAEEGACEGTTSCVVPGSGSCAGGVTPRRWIVLSNPKLSALITSKIGDRWISNLEEELERIESWAEDPDFQREWQAVKADNKRALAGFIKERAGIAVDLQSPLALQVKRLHAYTRQPLNRH